MAQAIGNPRCRDVIVIGGGVIGFAIALRLAEEGMKVTLLERGEFGAEASTAAAGMIAPQGETSDFGDFFELCSASRDLYPAFVRKIAELNGIRNGGETFGYRRDGILMVATSDDEILSLERLYETQRRHGLALKRVDTRDAQRMVPGLSLETRRAVLIQDDHWVDNERLMPAMVEAAQKLGVTCLAHTAARRFDLSGGCITSVETGPDSGGAGIHYCAGCFIVAAGCWSGEVAAQAGSPLPLAPCRGQIIEFESPSELPTAIRQGHFYLVPRKPCRVLAGTTAEYAGQEKAVTGEGLKLILEGVERFAPFVRKLKFRRAWAGLRPDTPDHLPILGRAGIENLIIATGHFRNGILLAPVTAQLISELVLTRSTSRPLEAYRPSRFL
jgi:glycine oxidase